MEEDMTDPKLSEIIATAIKREEDAYAFYMDLHGRLDDPGVKDSIEWIAGEEKKHKEFLVSYRDGGYSPEVLQLKKVQYLKIAEHQKEPEIEAGMPSEDVFLLASHREYRSFHFYTQLAELHAEGEIREVLLKMANEELKHKEKMEYLYANTAFPQTDGG
jgi:rubrerythrin